MFFNRTKIPTPVIGRIPYGTSIPILIIIGLAVSERSFEKLLTRTDKDDKGRQVMEIVHMAFGKVKGSGSYDS